MKKLMSRLSLCTLLMFFATLFACQLYTNDVEAADKAMGESYNCTLDRSTDVTAFVDIKPKRNGYTYYVTISWNGGSWTDTIHNRWGQGNWIKRSYRLGKDHASYSITVKSSSDNDSSTYHVGFTKGVKRYS